MRTVGSHVQGCQQIFVLFVELRALPDKQVDNLPPLGIRRSHRAMLEIGR